MLDEVSSDRVKELEQRALHERRRGVHRAAADAYRELESLEPAEPTWPKALAECLERDQAEPAEILAALNRAASRYVDRGFVVRAIAIHKMILRRAPNDQTALDALVELQGRRQTGLDRFAGRSRAARTTLDAPMHDQGGFAVATGVYDIAVASPRAAPSSDDEPPRVRTEAHAPPELESLASSPIFDCLSPSALRLLVDAVRLVELRAGQVLYRKGDPATSMYMVIAGRIALVDADPLGPPLAELDGGDVLGVVGFCAAAPRATTAVARADTELVEIPGYALDVLFEVTPDLRYALLALARERLLAVLLSTHYLFSGLPSATRDHLQDRFRFFEVLAGAPLVKVGTAPDHLYVVMTGRLDVIGVDGEVVAGLGTGCLAAESEFLARQPVVLPIVAQRKSFVLALPHADFEDIARRHPGFRDHVVSDAAAPIWDPSKIS